jgi:hypothetical protein
MTAQNFHITSNKFNTDGICIEVFQKNKINNPVKLYLYALGK